MKNVELIKSEQFREVRGKVPAQVKQELSAAIKAGILGKIKKTALTGDIYYAKEFEKEAYEYQNEKAKQRGEKLAENLAKILV